MIVLKVAGHRPAHDQIFTPQISKCVNQAKRNVNSVCFNHKYHYDSVNIVAGNYPFIVSNSSPHCDHSDDANCDQKDQNGDKQHRN